ncbi:MULTISPECIES: hypothetical protein [Rhodococcus]|uniref:Uncharacterized protein n=1 Tax=Rhodococcus rhodochrous J45 TaxID=935266 RepID=A0A562EPH8_RHORH|nr:MULTISPECIES: hypothetical protein [Rhodococcus]MCR8694534.1 hypothetical protein [Rhodococcus pyridinivorans]MXQ77268.1 hypothetical protein [Rhodococcus rhodochrous]OWY79889.1 hypothetical protein B9C99_20275 [Rhodococcus sp. BUPNP1]QHG81186.1 hypothetical protein D1O33_03970 [Rhodococcus rhodochrous]QOH54812.1 hypothetical protein C6Y44_01670 [Rhodococcus rhodochrous]
MRLVTADDNFPLAGDADHEQASVWVEMLDREIDEVSAAIEKTEQKALAEHRVGAVDRARRFDAEVERLGAQLRELHRMRRNLTDRFS